MIFNPIHEFQIPLLNVCIKPCRIENMPLYFQSRLSEGWPGCFHPKHEKWSSISYTFFPSFFFFFFFRWGGGLKEGDVPWKWCRQEALQEIRGHRVVGQLPSADVFYGTGPTEAKLA